MSRRTVYLNTMGQLYQLTHTQYLRWLRDFAADAAVDLEHYGKHVGHIEHNVTDWNPEDASDVLSEQTIGKPLIKIL